MGTSSSVGEAASVKNSSTVHRRTTFVATPLMILRMRNGPRLARRSVSSETSARARRRSAASGPVRVPEDGARLNRTARTSSADAFCSSCLTRTSRKVCPLKLQKRSSLCDSTRSSMKSAGHSRRRLPSNSLRSQDLTSLASTRGKPHPPAQPPTAGPAELFSLASDVSLVLGIAAQESDFDPPGARTYRPKPRAR